MRISCLAEVLFLRKKNQQQQQFDVTLGSLIKNEHCVNLIVLFWPISTFEVISFLFVCFWLFFCHASAREWKNPISWKFSLHLLIMTNFSMFPHAKWNYFLGASVYTLIHLSEEKIVPASQSWLINSRLLLVTKLEVLPYNLPLFLTILWDHYRYLFCKWTQCFSFCS